MVDDPKPRDEPRISVPAGVLLARDAQGREITVDAVIADPGLIDSIVPETLAQAGVKLLLQIGVEARRLKRESEKRG